MNNETKYVSSGVGLGTVIAVVISWSAWHSLPWVVLHGLLGWIYVIYYLFKYIA